VTVLVFLTSVRHPDTSTDHRRVEQLLETTLRSLCAQDDGDVRVVVVGNERPRVGVDDPRVVYHVVDFPVPAGGRQATGRDAKAIDKGTKLLSGLLFARRYRPDHVALVDADDVVSRRIAGFVDAHPGADGWYVDQGYTLNRATWRVQRRHSLVRYCGSGMIVRGQALYDLARAEEARGLDESSTQDELLAGTPPSFLRHVLCDHTFTVRYLANHDIGLRPLPFRAAAWVQETGENYSRPTGTASGVPVTPAFCREFGIADPPPGAGEARPADRVREALVCARSRVGALLDPVTRGA
jgi:hypothetical protein